MGNGREDHHGAEGSVSKEAVMRRAFIPMFRWDPHVTNKIFFDRLPYCDGDLERWADDGGRVNDALDDLDFESLK